MTQASKKRPDTPIEVLCKLLKLDPETGKLYWLDRPLEFFDNARDQRVWNARFAGKEAFTSNNGKGYLNGSILNRKYLAHRVVYALYTGSWPIKDIDHIDGDGMNNRPNNLRLATVSENGQNLGIHPNSPSGIQGVCWFARKSCWNSQITFERQRANLGYFQNIDDALAARQEAERLLGFPESNRRIDEAKLVEARKRVGRPCLPRRRTIQEICAKLLVSRAALQEPKP